MRDGGVAEEAHHLDGVDLRQTVEEAHGHLHLRGPDGAALPRRVAGILLAERRGDIGAVAADLARPAGLATRAGCIRRGRTFQPHPELLREEPGIEALDPRERPAVAAHRELAAASGTRRGGLAAPQAPDDADQGLELDR